MNMMNDSQQVTGSNRQPRISNQRVKRIPLDQIHFSDTYNNRAGVNSNSRREPNLMIELNSKEDLARPEVLEFGSTSQRRAN